MSEAPEQPTYPTSQITITPEGIAISFILAPGLSITQQIADEAIYNIAKNLKEARREMSKNLDVVHDLKRNDGKIHTLRS